MRAEIRGRGMVDIDSNVAVAAEVRMKATGCHNRTRAFTWTLACLLALLSARAHAQSSLEPTPSPKTDSARPWAAGVSETEQTTALKLYVAGNREFTESHYAQALAQYKEAIQHWDHPAIRFNIAVCLINLDQPLEANDNLERGLAYGDRPLGASLYAQGLTYRKLLDAQLAHVKVACQDPGTQVTLDGKLLFTGPGTADQVVLAGEHQVVATKAGFLTVSKTLALVAGKPTTYEIRHLELKTAFGMARRWDSWKPWTVLGGGGALVGLGAWSYVAAASNFAGYDASIATRCPNSCNATTLAGFSDLRNKKDRAETEQVLAFSLLFTGSAVVIGGVIGLIVNQPRMQPEPNRALPVVAPTHGGAKVSMSWGF